MKRRLLLGLLVAGIGCSDTPQVDSNRKALVVEPTPAETLTARDAAPEERSERIEPSETTLASAPGANSKVEQLYPNIRKLCALLPRVTELEATPGSEQWKSQLELEVRDIRVFSPAIKKWNLASVDDPTKAKGVSHRGPFYGFGATVELENKSDQVLVGDNIYIGATFKSKTGERKCRASAFANRSWNKYAKKGKGAWVKEKAYSEYPLRPNERKRYVVANTDCFTEMFVETEPTDITLEVYARFRPLGQSDAVIAGPFETFKRKGDRLRGVPTADSTSTQLIRSKKAPIPVRVLYGVADQVLVAEDKKLRWVPEAFIVGTSPKNPLAMGTLPETTSSYSKQFGALTLKIDNWRSKNWHDFAGQLKQGQKMVMADVEMTVDTSSVQAALEAGVATATAQVTETQAALTERETALTAAEVTLATVKGTDSEKDAKAAAKGAKAAVKAAKKAVKAAEKGLKKAQKALGGGISKFLKSQAKAVDCGSFKVDVGRKQLKAFKGSMGKKECKAITGGQAVKGTIMFAVERWDMPFVLSWKSTGRGIETHRIASQAVGKILKD